MLKYVVRGDGDYFVGPFGPYETEEIAKEDLYNAAQTGRTAFRLVDETEEVPDPDQLKSFIVPDQG